MNRKNAFALYHPAVVFAYFAVVLFCTAVFTHPILLCSCFVCAAVYLFYLAGIAELVKAISLAVPVILFSALLNTVFNHRGATPVLYVNDKPITLESILFGVFTGVMICAMILWFRAYSMAMEPHRFLFLFAKAAPASAFIICMVFRYIPFCRRMLDEITAVQKAIGMLDKEKGIRKRLRVSASVFSALVSVSLEKTVGMSYSMNSRGYGLQGKTSYSDYRLELRDIILLVCLAAFSFYSLIVLFRGDFTFLYYHKMTGIQFSARHCIFILIFSLFCLMPLFANVWEDITWKLSQRKI